MYIYTYNHYIVKENFKTLGILFSKLRRYMTLSRTLIFSIRMYIDIQCYETDYYDFFIFRIN